jgi:hypothetical protein
MALFQARTAKKQLFIYLYINMDIRASLRVLRLISRVLKLTTI